MTNKTATSKPNPLKFGREVRAELDKVTWPNQKATRAMTVAVVALTVFITLFLVLADWVLGGAIQALLSS